MHPKVMKPIPLAGKPGEDAKQYQEKAVSGRRGGVETMKESARYAKIVEWSEEDHCFVGSCPGLFFGGLQIWSCGHHIDSFIFIKLFITI